MIDVLFLLLSQASHPPGEERVRLFLAAHCQEMLDRHRQYVVEHLDDMPEVKDWTWSPA